ncbi:Basic form of pathogenesis-related protein [Arachis hypogaea]|nr:Basic form of pathogenesis-related protein [Arachis hypogaea]
MGKIQPIPNPYYGQNVAWNLASDHFTGAKAVAMWVAQKKYYDHKSNSCIGGDCEFYTQVFGKTLLMLGVLQLSARNAK